MKQNFVPDVSSSSLVYIIKTSVLFGDTLSLLIKGRNSQCLVMLEFHIMLFYFFSHQNVCVRGLVGQQLYMLDCSSWLVLETKMSLLNLSSVALGNINDFPRFRHGKLPVWFRKKSWFE